MAILSRHHTYADLLRARESSDVIIELIEGELVVTPSPTPLHQFVNQRLYDLLKEAVFVPGLGLIGYAPLDVHFAEDTALQPDLYVYLNDRVNQIDDAYASGPPSLVIEIVSPSTSDYDRIRKRDIYAREGVNEYWIVDVEARTVTVLSDPRGRYQVETTSTGTAVSATIPGLIADVKRLFAPVRSRG